MLQTTLLQKLSIIEQEQEKTLYKWKYAAELAIATVFQLKQEMSDHVFEDEGQEILFYKEIVPWFYSQAIYYHRLFHIEAETATHSMKEEKKVVKKKLLKINKFLKRHHHLYLYIKLGKTNLDEQYFLRKNQDLLLYPNALSLMDNYHTEQVCKLAKILALEKIKEHLEAKLVKLEHHPLLLKGVHKGKATLRWTGSKSGLIELMYALHSSLLFNNGENIDLRQLANLLESVFHIKLGNYYRVFQGIRIRKKNRTQFLDDLKEKLILRMDNTDEHPRN